MASSWRAHQSEQWISVLWYLLVSVRSNTGEVERLRDGDKGQSDEPRVQEERKRGKSKAEEGYFRQRCVSFIKRGWAAWRGLVLLAQIRSATFMGISSMWVP